MSDFYVKAGDSVRFAKTVGESDSYMFAGITGDFAPNHVNQSYMERSHYKQRIAHGALLVGFMSTASTLAAAHRHEPSAENRANTSTFQPASFGSSHRKPGGSKSRSHKAGSSR